MVQKIISGGQTGVDQAALEVALFRDIPHGGWCPRGRRSETGPIPAQFQLQETDSRDYAVRTEQNVRDADGTLILAAGKIQGGTALTTKICRVWHRPCLVFDLETLGGDEHDQGPSAGEPIRAWIQQHNIQVLNVAGPRESTRPGIRLAAIALLLQVFPGPDEPSV